MHNIINCYNIIKYKLKKLKTLPEVTNVYIQGKLYYIKYKHNLYIFLKYFYRINLNDILYENINTDYFNEKISDECHRIIKIKLDDGYYIFFDEYFYITNIKLDTIRDKLAELKRYNNEIKEINIIKNSPKFKLNQAVKAKNYIDDKEEKFYKWKLKISKSFIDTVIKINSINRYIKKNVKQISKIKPLQSITKQYIETLIK